MYALFKKRMNNERMKIDILTIFPKMFTPILDESIIKRARQKGLVKINAHNIRDYSKDKHRKIDDRPFGGGPGMVFKPEPIFEAVKKIKKGHTKNKVILLSPQGRKLTQQLAKKLSRYKHLILICARYEGIDERVRTHLIDEEVSIGDYVVTGGELPAMVLIDAVVRLIPNVVGDKESVKQDSFSNGLLEYPQYTRPANFGGKKVPTILLSGDHKKISEWRRKQSKKVTKAKRPDLLKK